MSTTGDRLDTATEKQKQNQNQAPEGREDDDTIYKSPLFETSDTKTLPHLQNPH